MDSSGTCGEDYSDDVIELNERTNELEENYVTWRGKGFSVGVLVGDEDVLFAVIGVAQKSVRVLVLDEDDLTTVEHVVRPGHPHRRRTAPLALIYTFKKKKKFNSSFEFIFSLSLSLSLKLTLKLKLALFLGLIRLFRPFFFTFTTKFHNFKSKILPVKPKLALFLALIRQFVPICTNLNKDQFLL